MLEFDFWAQVMAAHGWLVLRPNYRGSPNLGLAYQRAILYDPEEGPGKDIMAALEAVRARGIVDGSRIAVSGWSTTASPTPTSSTDRRSSTPTRRSGGAPRRFGMRAT